MKGKEDMNWTEEQKKAIELRNKNILVAAAAGSGKTAVLVERIKKLIIEDGVSIDNMLVVTFTNAAAAEMKEKIRTAINKEIDANPEKRDTLRQQLNILYRANISTFHAFALDVIRHFFYIINIEPNFKICDDAQRQIIKGEALDLLLERYFEEGSQEFFDFLRWYSSDRNEEKIKQMIDSSYNILQSFPEPFNWLDEKVENLRKSPEEFKKSNTMGFIWSFIEKSNDEALKAYLMAEKTLEDLPRLAGKVAVEETQICRQIAEACKDRDLSLVESLILGMKSARLVAKKEEKEVYEEVKEGASALRKKASGLIKELGNILFKIPFDSQIEEINDTYDKGLFFKKILEDFDVLFKEGKKAKNLVDFNDIEHYCIEILKSDEACQFYRDKFQYIFIDEYQDTNLLQEAIVGSIKRDNNLFMVGDIKQSIYKFRLAEPDIFKKKYESYSSEAETLSEKIDLNKNYRSKETVVKQINMTFQAMMEGYDHKARLYQGKPSETDITFKPRLKVIDLSTVNEADEELQNLKNAEFEALEVAKIIDEYLGREYTDSKTGEIKKLVKKDIVILMRSVKNYADIFYNVLQNMGIPAYVDDNDGYFDTMEINVFMNLLSVIDNKRQDIPLISVLRSEIFGFSIEELSVIRSEYQRGTYFDAFSNYSQNGIREELKNKCVEVLENLNKWRTQCSIMSLDKFIWKLLIETDYYIIMGAMPLGNQRQGNLRALVDKALKFQQNGQGSLYSFMKYIDAVKTRKVSMGQVKLVGENDDLVRIMTIHKSKGLEFPMVILSGLGKKLNYSKGGKGIIFHKDIGLGMSIVNPKEHWHKNTILQRVISRQIHLEEVEEEIRVLYVALTRAKDILIMTGTVKDGEKYLQNWNLDIKGDSTYLSMMGNATPVVEMINCDSLSFFINDESKFAEINNSIEVAENIKDEVYRRLNYKYPYSQALSTKSKYSVSEINSLNYQKEKQYKSQLAVPKFCQRETDRKLSPAEIGTVYHGIMERVDFGQIAREGIKYLNEITRDFVNCGIFDEKEVEAVSLDKIIDFFESDLGRRMVTAYEKGCLYREVPFNLAWELNGEEVLVQGIIDCYFEENDRLVLLDYKTNTINKNMPKEDAIQGLKETYSQQLKLYSQALETIKQKKVDEAYLYIFSTGDIIDM